MLKQRKVGVGCIRDFHYPGMPRDRKQNRNKYTISHEKDNTECFIIRAGFYT